MARDVPAAQQLTSAGLLAAYTAPTANNDQIANNGRRFLHVKNGSGGSINVTENIGSLVDGQAPAARVVAIAAAAEKFFGPWPANVNQADGNVYIDYSAVASVTRAVLELPVV